MIYFCVGMTYCNQKSGGLNSCMLFTVGLGQLATVLNETGTLIQYPSCPWSIEPLKLPNCWLARNWGHVQSSKDSFVVAPANAGFSTGRSQKHHPEALLKDLGMRKELQYRDLYIYMSIASKLFTNRIDSWTSCKRNCVAEVLKAVMSRKDPLTSTWLLHQPCAV